MADGIFKYESDLLKHHVRITGWLPSCKRRLKAVRGPGSNARRLRYFTFCAVGAIDVLMLDVAKVVTPSASDKFDTVVFFDKNEEFVHETQKRIPGSAGFPGKFTEVVLRNDPDEQRAVDDSLDAPPEMLDEAATHRRQMERAQRHQFIRTFPFDIINLDLEEFLFKPNDPLPGRVVNSLRKIFEWQCREGVDGNGKPFKIDGFSLMFTTQIGPPNLNNDYLGMMEQYLRDNIAADGQLMELLNQRTGLADVQALRENNFEQFFKLAMPKVLARALMEKDWYIDPENGVVVYEFERESEDGPYKILHLVMDVKRIDPPHERRAPGQVVQQAERAYQEVVRGIFRTEAQKVTANNIDNEELRDSLKKIAGRRKKYYPEDEGIEV